MSDVDDVVMVFSSGWTVTCHTSTGITIHCRCVDTSAECSTKRRATG